MCLPVGSSKMGQHKRSWLTIFLLPEAILHSDQGMHYPHPGFRLLVAKAGFQQSMSRKKNCWDNASMETFLGHMRMSWSIIRVLLFRNYEHKLRSTFRITTQVENDP